MIKKHGTDILTVKFMNDIISELSELMLHSALKELCIKTTNSMRMNFVVEISLLVKFCKENIL